MLDFLLLCLVLLIVWGICAGIVKLVRRIFGLNRKKEDF